MGSANYTTISDARQAVRDCIYNVSNPASEGLVEQAARRAFDNQETVDEALKALSAEGVDCEGFEG